MQSPGSPNESSPGGDGDAPKSGALIRRRRTMELSTLDSGLLLVAVTANLRAAHLPPGPEDPPGLDLKGHSHGHAVRPTRREGPRSI